MDVCVWACVGLMDRSLTASWIILLAESWIRSRRSCGSGASPCFKAHIKFPSLSTQSLPCHLRGDGVCAVCTLHSIQSFCHLSLFTVLWMGKNKPLHVVCKQVFKYKCMIKPAPMCEDFYYVLHFWLICGCGGNKDRHRRSVKSWQVIDTQRGGYKCEYWRCVFVFFLTSQVPLCAMSLNA